jgi:hypothetical protein
MAANSAQEVEDFLTASNCRDAPLYGLFRYQNRANLRDYALASWEQANELPHVRGELFHRSSRVE